MRIKTTFISILFFVIFSITAREPLPAKEGIYFGINRYLLSPTGLSFSSNMILDNTSGFRKSVYSSNLLTVGISELLNPSVKLAFRYDNKIIDRITLSNRMKLFNFFHIITGYTWWNYYEYRVSENNLYFMGDVRFGLPKYFLISHVAGCGVKIVDVDTATFGNTYNEDYLSQVLFMWKVSVNFFLTKYYHIGLEVTDTYDDDPFSFGYYQIALLNSIFPSKIYGLTFDLGIGFAGTGSLAGYPNRYFIAIGGIYEHYLR